MYPTEQEIEAVKASNPGADLHLIEHGESAIVVRVPSRIQWRRFIVESSNKTPGASSVAMENILAAVTVWPRSTADLYDARPGLVETFAGKVCELAGLASEASAKKI
jgi:hypothetical protein